MDMVREKFIYCTPCDSDKPDACFDRHLLDRHLLDQVVSYDRDVKISHGSAGVLFEKLVKAHVDRKNVENVFLRPSFLFSAGILIGFTKPDNESPATSWHNFALNPYQPRMNTEPILNISPLHIFRDLYVPNQEAAENGVDPLQGAAENGEVVGEAENGEVVGEAADENGEVAGEAAAENVGLLANVIWDWFV